jgi:hypothetical protein
MQGPKLRRGEDQMATAHGSPCQNRICWIQTRYLMAGFCHGPAIAVPIHFGYKRSCLQ